MLNEYNRFVMDITNILPLEELENYISAIENRQNYKYDSNGLQIELNYSDNGEYFSINYSKPNDEKQEFTKFVNSLDDDLFAEVCENLDVNKLAKAFDSNDIESVRSAINKFKITLKKICQDKIDYYSNILENA